jgi:hypothetical protein
MLVKISCLFFSQLPYAIRTESCLCSFKVGNAHVISKDECLYDNGILHLVPNIILPRTDL